VQAVYCPRGERNLKPSFALLTKHVLSCGIVSTCSRFSFYKDAFSFAKSCAQSLLGELIFYYSYNGPILLGMKPSV
jgi:hypothetical protein